MHIFCNNIKKDLKKNANLNFIPNLVFTQMNADLICIVYGLRKNIKKHQFFRTKTVTYIHLRYKNMHIQYLRIGSFFTIAKF